MNEITLIRFTELFLCLTVFSLGLYAFVFLKINNFNKHLYIFCFVSSSIALCWGITIGLYLVHPVWYNPCKHVDLFITVNVIQTLSLLLYALILITLYMFSKKTYNIINK